MLCQSCNQNEASIHYFESFNGNTKTLNLCELCAQRQGVAGLGLSVLDAAQLADEPEEAGGSQEAAVAQEPCVGCGMTYADYRHDPSHACPACQDSFATRGQLRRKMARPLGVSETLKRRLAQAIDEEDFETAAILRDQLRLVAAPTARD
jgi:protein arginine kinase activator